MSQKQSWIVIRLVGLPTFRAPSRLVLLVDDRPRAIRGDAHFETYEIGDPWSLIRRVQVGIVVDTWLVVPFPCGFVDNVARLHVHNPGRTRQTTKKQSKWPIVKSIREALAMQRKENGSPWESRM